MAAVCSRVAPVDGYTVRPWKLADASVLHAAWSDPDIARWNPVPPDGTEALAARWIAGTAQQTEASVGIDVVLLDEAHEVCGEIGLQVDPAQNVAEVGFWLRAESRGRRVGRYLLSFAVELASAIDLIGVVALVDVENESAIQLLQRSGWTEMPTKSERRAFARRVGPLSAG